VRLTRGDIVLSSFLSVFQGRCPSFLPGAPRISLKNGPRSRTARRCFRRIYSGIPVGNNYIRPVLTARHRQSFAGCSQALDAGRDGRLPGAVSTPGRRVLIALDGTEHVVCSRKDQVRSMSHLRRSDGGPSTSTPSSSAQPGAGPKKVLLPPAGHPNSSPPPNMARENVLRSKRRQRWAFASHGPAGHGGAKPPIISVLWVSLSNHDLFRLPAARHRHPPWRRQLSQ